MKEPTREQLREFWEWCGFELVAGVAVPYWLYPDGRPITRSDDVPRLDLNNLFKWAVPKLTGCHLYAHREKGIRMWTSYVNGETIEATDDDPALALFWAIWEVIKSG